MKKYPIHFLAAMLMLVTGPAAYGLTIVPTWDASITTNPQAAAITNGIMFAIQTLESDIANNLTVNIEFVDSSSVGLGENNTWQASVPYSSYLSNLRSSATSVNDKNALSQLPNSSTDPVIGSSSISITWPLIRLFGFYSGYESEMNGLDGTVYLNVPIMNLTRPGTNPNNYDLVSVTEHEMDEVLGFISTLGDGSASGPIGPMDLFRYSTNATGPLTRTWTTSGDNAFFSVDGTNLLARFNQHADADYHDWWSYSGLWAPPGVTPYPQVQDAYAYPGTSPDLGSNELAGLDIIGYTLTTSLPKLRIAASGKNDVTVSWFGNSSGYILQQSTNLAKNAWVEAPSGSTNWMMITSAGPDVFYRLSKTQTLPALATPALSLNNLSLKLVKHVSRPRP